jgi:4-hydroxy-tetrahydrodipicolinate reductase
VRKLGGVILRIGLFGFGRAGRAVASVVLDNKQHILEWVIRKSKNLDHRSAPEYLGVPSSEEGLIYPIDDINYVFKNEKIMVDGIIDFSSRESIFEYGEYARENNICVVTAISHYEKKEIDYLHDLSKDIRVLWSPNITIGINFLLIAARVLQKIAPYADIEILIVTGAT